MMMTVVVVVASFKATKVGKRQHVIHLRLYLVARKTHSFKLFKSGQNLNPKHVCMHQNGL